MGRRTLIGALLALGTLIGVLAILAVWVSRQALDTDQWSKTSSKLLEDPAIQTVVAGFLVDQLYANVNVAGELRAALPARAQPLATPAAGALRSAAENIARRALDRPRVQEAWERANRTAHQQLVDVIEGGGDVVGTQNGTVTLDLKALLNEIAARTGVGGRVADRLPASAASIEILRSDQLDTVQKVGKALKPLAAVLVIAMLACFAGAVALAKERRRQTLRACGFALILAGIAALVARRLVGDAVVSDLASTATVQPAVEAVWRIGTSLLVGVAVATIVYGVLVVIAAWVAGPTRVAVGARETLAPYLRDPWITYGVLAIVVLLVLLWGPTEATRRALPALVLIAFLVAGVEVLRRQVAREFPDATRGDGGMARMREAMRNMRRPSFGSNGDTEVEQLHRLSELHRAGELDDAEFTTAKQQILASTKPSTPVATGASTTPRSTSP